jgi:tRNA A-37 threonylcarbamoyl transferase component Bud32
MDITSSNIMLRKDSYEAWDQLRLLDFGFAQFCSAGKHALLAWL